MIVTYHYPATGITEVVTVNNPDNLELFITPYTVGITPATIL